MSRPPSKLQRTITVEDLDESELLYSQLLDTDDSPKFNPATQSAANLDNLHSAFQHLDNSHPVAINTDEAMAYVKAQLFPDPPVNDDFPLPNNKATSPPGFRQNLLPDDDKFITAVRRIKTGTASGPFADSPELFRAFALTPSQRYGPDKEITYPNLSLARSFINILHNAELPDDVLPAFNASYFLALHKKVGLRPILIGTSLKRILGTMESSAFASDFASHLAPFQYGIALPEGMQFLTMAIRNLIHDLLPGGSNSTSASHVLLFFDIANMFNSVSQKSSRHELEQTMPFLLPSFDMRYREANLCWYKKLDGSWAHFKMTDGFPQGDALSSFLSCLTLHAVLSQLHKDLTIRAEQRIPIGRRTRSRPPTEPPMGAYIDDAAALVPPKDSNFAFERFDELGKPRGIHLNLDKSIILSTLDPTKPMSHPALDQALSKLKPSNHLQNGVVYLGSPIGNSDYVANALTEAAKHFDIRRKAIQNQLEDLQTQTVLFSKCLLPSIPHLLATDVLLHFPSFRDDFDPYSWTSPFIKLLQSSTATFLAHVTGRNITEVLPNTHPWHIAHFPISSGGLGFQDFSARAIASFIVPFAGTIRHSLEGFSLRNSESLLRPPPALATRLSAWSTATTQQAIAFRFLAPRLLSFETIQGITDPIQDLVNTRTLRTLLRDLTRAHKK